MRKVLASLLAASLLASTSAPAAMNPIGGDPVTIDSGRVSGTMLSSGVRAYLGIPFAEPPVGQLRWAAPKPVKWDGIFNADRKGPECIQVLRPHNINHYFGEEPSSEDCLYMNVWTPPAAKPGAKLPVIVFIYGGGFTIGSSGMANYDGENVAKAGAVYVNFNYRVGAMGFLAHPELTAEQGGHSGNYALMDQALALKWIHDNIDKFGGDPAKVLIMGQSAGARSVALQMFNPMARGLFRAAVMSSGCNFVGESQLGGTMMTLPEAEKVGLAYQEKLGAKNLEDLRALPADKILSVQSETQVGARVEGVRIQGAIVDGYVLPRQNFEMLASGDIARVPIIASYNSDDIDAGMSPLSRVKTVAEYKATVEKLYGPNAEAYLKAFPIATDAEVPALAKRYATMAGLEKSSRQCALAMQKLGVNGYVDEYTRKHPYAPGVKIADQNIETVGAYHTADMPYWLNTLDKYNMLRTTRAWTPGDRELSAQMLGALIAMAETGSPSTKALPWTPLTMKTDAKMDFDVPARMVPLDGKKLDWLVAHPATPVARSTTPDRPRD
ncbi:carboxylesterase family protein [Sphingomonas sp. AP4-R1]|uniref:carboxylesterase/lipase family protein n=1 Tax=Sphingomonas sp. AP4-R1 TaxID=2735134 RepID=UPI0014936665|nr:carboxylesterase family protein [Sphingomonas sp. AP4-R1]QJU60033.1 carboxylesterase family protein [Sphingomonas sp. AP4-R1]